MLRSLAETREKFDREQIEKTLEESAHAVFGTAELARAMRDGEFADLEPAGGGEHGDEAVQFAVQPNLAQHLGAIALHAAVVVVQPNPGESAHQPVEQSARPNLVPGIEPGFLPTADHVEAFVELAQE